MHAFMILIEISDTLVDGHFVIYGFKDGQQNNHYLMVFFFVGPCVYWQNYFNPLSDDKF